MVTKARELIDITDLEYFVGLERKYFCFETSDDLIRERCEKDFLEASNYSKKKMHEISLTFNKFITFDLEGVIKIRMLIPLEYLREKDGYTYCAIETPEAKEKPFLSKYLNNATLKSIDYNYGRNETIYNDMASVLDEIRKKFPNTLYYGTNMDFTEDFFESFYKKHIEKLVIDLANTHFEEVEVKKYGNSYSILYRDLAAFKNQNPNYNEFDISESIRHIFTKVSLPFEFENLEVDNTRFSETDSLFNYKLSALILEDEVFEDYNISEEGISEDEFDRRFLYMRSVIDFIDDITSIPDEEFTFEMARNMCNYYRVGNKIYERTKALPQMLESTIFLKYFLKHYIALFLFYKNYFIIKREVEKQKSNM